MKTASPALNKAVLIFSVLAFTLLMSSVAFAQTGTSSLRGTITDLQGRAVSGAQVTITNEEKSFTRNQNTNEDGAYVFTSIPPGSYRLEVEAKGFKKGVLTDVNAQVAKATTVSLQLEIGNVSEVVTVSAGAGEVVTNKQDGTLGNNFVSQQITQLPLEARSPLALVTLQPGVTKEGYVAGARADQSASAIQLLIRLRP